MNTQEPQKKFVDLVLAGKAKWNDIGHYINLHAKTGSDASGLAEFLGLKPEELAEYAANAESLRMNIHRRLPLLVFRRNDGMAVIFNHGRPVLTSSRISEVNEWLITRHPGETACWDVQAYHDVQ